MKKIVSFVSGLHPIVKFLIILVGITVGLPTTVIGGYYLFLGIPFLFIALCMAINLILGIEF